jgi:hypothetical protein
VLNAVSVDYTGYLGASGSEALVAANIVDNVTGQVSLAVSRLYPYLPVSGGGVLANVHFLAIGNGTSTLHLFETYLSDGEGRLIPHQTADGQVTVLSTNLVVDSVVVLDGSCTVYANDTYLNGTAYCVPVEIAVRNLAGASSDFNVSLTVYSFNVSLTEDYFEWRVLGLSAGANVTLTYNWCPTHTGYYDLTAVADCHGEVVESNEADNTLVLSNFPVALQGDVNRDHSNNILDVGVVTLAWGARPGDPHWNICADLSHDEKINIMDIARITLRWRQTW